MCNIRKKVLSMLLGLGLVSILLYSVVYIMITTSSYARHLEVTPTPTPTPTPITSPTPPPPPPPPTGKLEIQTIPQEDQLRKKGIMILCPSGASPEPCINIPFANIEVKQVRDFHAEYKIHFALDGINVDPDTLTCIVVQKDVCHVGEGGKRGGPRQFPSEIEATDAINISTKFKCKYRQSEKPGVGVLDVYFLEDPAGTTAPSPLFIGDHILKVEAEVSGVLDSEIQDLCILGAPICVFTAGGNCVQTGLLPSFFFDVKWPDNEVMLKFADPLFRFAGCKNATLFEREYKYNVKVSTCSSLFIPGLQDP